MNKQPEPVIFAYSFNGEGKATKLSNKEVAKELENNGLAWVHLDLNSPNFLIF